MTHEDFYELFPTEESYNKMVETLDPDVYGDDANQND